MKINSRIYFITYNYLNNKGIRQIESMQLQIIKNNYIFHINIRE